MSPATRTAASSGRHLARCVAEDSWTGTASRSTPSGRYIGAASSEYFDPSRPAKPEAMPKELNDAPVLAPPIIETISSPGCACRGSRSIALCSVMPQETPTVLHGRARRLSSR